MNKRQLLDELTLIAQRNADVDTLESRMSDSKDFHDVSVWQLRDMLVEAYELGLSERPNK